MLQGLGVIVCLKTGASGHGIATRGVCVAGAGKLATGLRWYSDDGKDGDKGGVGRFWRM